VRRPVCSSSSNRTWSPPTLRQRLLQTPQRLSSGIKLVRCSPLSQGVLWQTLAPPSLLPPAKREDDCSVARSVCCAFPAPRRRPFLTHGAALRAAPTEEEVALREMQEMEVMAAVDAGASQGDVEAETSNGSRVWQETGQDELEGGRLCRWTVVRGQSADGTTEWEEKFWEVRFPLLPHLPRRRQWWRAACPFRESSGTRCLSLNRAHGSGAKRRCRNEGSTVRTRCHSGLTHHSLAAGAGRPQTSDAWGYRELGAEKSGRDSKGNVWNERWMECMEQQGDTGLSSVQRTCVLTDSTACAPRAPAENGAGSAASSGGNTRRMKFSGMGLVRTQGDQVGKDGRERSVVRDVE
jgi:hypothetical protein